MTAGIPNLLIGLALALASSTAWAGEPESGDATHFDLRATVADESQSYFVRNMSTAATCHFDSSAPEAERVLCGPEAFTRYSGRVVALGFGPSDGSGTVDVVGVTILGFGFSIDGAAAGDEGGAVQLEFHTPDGGRMRVNAADDADGTDRASIVIDNASAKDADEFIDDIEQASGEERAAMRAALDL